MVAQVPVRGKGNENGRSEDLFLADFIIKHQVVKETEVRYALAMQEALCRGRVTEVPRLVDLLKEQGALDEQKIPVLLKAMEGIRALEALKQPSSNGEARIATALNFSATKATADTGANGSDKSSPAAPANPKTPITSSQEPRHVLPVRPAPLRRAAENAAADSSRPTTSMVVAKGETHGLGAASKNKSASTEKQPEEAREHTRFQVKDATVHFAKAGLFSSFDAQQNPSPLVNLSLGGLCIVSPQPFNVGDHFKLLMHMPALKRDLEAKAEVRGCATIENKTRALLLGMHFKCPNHYKISLKFIELSPEVRQQIELLAYDPTLQNRGKFRRY